MVDKNLYYFEADVGKKVYEIEHETTYVTKWQVVAEDRDQAFDIYLEHSIEDFKTEDLQKYGEFEKKLVDHSQEKYKE